MTVELAPFSRLIDIAMLNGMASSDFLTALDRHVALGLRLLDLKDAIFGKSIGDLSEAEAHQAAEAIQRRGLRVFCLSTTLFHRDVEAGESAFRADLEKLQNVLNIARILQPKAIRVLSATTARRREIADTADYLDGSHPWVYRVYRDAVDHITAAGHAAMIENEVGANIFSAPVEILAFFHLLNRPAARLIWDVVNLWQVGTAPSLGVYHQLRPIIGGLHLKGGQANSQDGSLQWASSLEDSTWPILGITRQGVHDRACPVIVLNPPHGKFRPGYDYDNLPARDLAYLRSEIPELAR
jgi:hypothetical protein